MAKQETTKTVAKEKSGPARGGQEVKAHARFVHASPQKLRLVADLIRRARVDKALEQLKFSSKNAALPISKLLNSAIANAVHNFNLNKEDLVVKAITVDGGPVMKRMFPRAQGRAEIIRRRMSHINIILESRPKTKSTKKSRSVFVAKEQPDNEAKPVNNEVEADKVENKNDHQHAAPRSEERVKKQASAVKRRLFNRKSGE
jgi:large subunit ribosomal protein L22